jgi:hypothetical protein
LSTLFETGIKLVFPLSPYAFVIFISSIYDKILHLHETSKRYDSERLQFKRTIEKERIIHSNSLIVLNRQYERRIILLKKYFSK